MIDPAKERLALDLAERNGLVGWRMAVERRIEMVIEQGQKPPPRDAILASELSKNLTTKGDRR